MGVTGELYQFGGVHRHFILKRMRHRQRWVRYEIRRVLLFVYHSTVRCLEGSGHRPQSRTIVKGRDRSVSKAWRQRGK